VAVEKRAQNGHTRLAAAPLERGTQAAWIDQVLFVRLVDRRLEAFSSQPRRQVEECADWAGEGDVVAAADVLCAQPLAAMNPDAPRSTVDRRRSGDLNRSLGVPDAP
jgi:hypothetical protein